MKGRRILRPNALVEAGGGEAVVGASMKGRRILRPNAADRVAVLARRPASMKGRRILRPNDRRRRDAERRCTALQ